LASPRPDVAQPAGARPASIGAEIAAGAAALRQARVPRARRTALDTWAALEGRSPGAVWLDRAGRPGTEVRERFRRAITQQAAGAPFAHATGQAEFRTLRLAVDRRVLIPRPETEGLVDHVLEWARRRWPEGQRWGQAADIGTGSGAIALSLAVEGAFRRIIATDVSSGALAVARDNSARVAPAAPVVWREGALLVPLEGAVVDVLVSNPPYITTAECEGLDASVRDHEPRLALDGGTDGMDIIRGIVRGAAQHLATGGLLALEIDSRRPGEALACARHAGWSGALIAPDAFGRPRYLLAEKD
jgi:release factor glutamine methyltransferase